MDGLGNPQSLLVLGGSSEIGVATAVQLANQRCRRVVLAGRPGERLDAAAAQVAATGGRVTVTTVDFDALDVDGHAHVVELAFADGDIDVAVIAAGVLGDQDQAKVDASAAVHLAMVNYVGAVSVGTHVLNAMRRQGHGVLVVLSSVAGERPRKANVVYGSSKAGLDAWATGMGDELHGSGVRVLVVRPGFVHTRMTDGMPPAPMSTTPEAVAEVIVAGIRSGKETVWAPPPARYAMSVLRHLPRAAFRRLPR